MRPYSPICYSLPYVQFSAEILSRRHPELLEKYGMSNLTCTPRYSTNGLCAEQKKEDGSLAPFDPSATYVHPASRVKMVIRLKNKREKTRIDLESSEDEFAQGMSSDDAFSISSDNRPRRSTRAAAADAQQKLTRSLAFSPRKTRSKRIITIHSSGSEFEEVDDDIADSPSRSSTPERLSTRSRRKVVHDEDDSDQYIPGSPKLKASKKKGKSRKRSLPAYGFFRPIDDLEDEDDEDAALRAHRKLCERCLKAPSHILLSAYQKRLKRGRGRKKKNDDIDEQDEEAQLNALGGWVRW